MKPNKLLILGILALPIFLSACGGGSGSSANTATTAGSGSSATTINGISVPPAPDPVINNATLAGVDSNKNGVRDDVDRFSAIETKGEQTKLNTYLLAAKTAQTALLENKEVTYRQFECDILGLSLIEQSILINTIFNTAERYASYKLSLTASNSEYTCISSTKPFVSAD